ncbi:unnamed protein product [Cylicostephanus goldi]|uniref:C-type lectin domain-containing protein n=1 Tax=Cylicostephanus goldi TaxID=71465 RepID=A0A3P7LZN6_CYLGO|nr:unnamed protein product [Cylicostephanus goldi]
MLHSNFSAHRGYCDSGWTYFNETEACYKNFFWATFHDAENLCKNFDGHLTSIHSYSENSFVAELAKSGLRMTDNEQSTWIGLVRSNHLNSNWTDDWMWTDGTKVDFLAWAPDEPNNWKGKQRCVLV